MRRTVSVLSFAALAVGLFALALVACDARVDDTTTPAVADAGVKPAPATNDLSSATDAVPAPSPAMPGLALSPEGLALVDPVSGSARLLRFGSDSAPLIDALTRVLGAAPELGENGECGAGPLDFANWRDGLSVLSQQGKFVGWSTNQGERGDSASRLATMSGIGIGATRTQLEAVHAMEVMETTLGTEFVAGGLYGVLESAKPDARITAMWAGTSCVFR